MKRIEVAVGVIFKEQQVFISKRADDLHQGGKWEFPGGKREQHESLRQALTRELEEEVGITVLQAEQLLTISHDYPDKQVLLSVELVTEFSGTAAQLEGQEARWVNVAALHTYSFPEANQPIIAALQQRFL